MRGAVLQQGPRQPEAGRGEAGPLGLHRSAEARARPPAPQHLREQGEGLFVYYYYFIFIDYLKNLIDHSKDLFS